MWKNPVVTCHMNETSLASLKGFYPLCSFILEGKHKRKRLQRSCLNGYDLRVTYEHKEMVEKDKRGLHLYVKGEAKGKKFVSKGLPML